MALAERDLANCRAAGRAYGCGSNLAKRSARRTGEKFGFVPEDLAAIASRAQKPYAPSFLQARGDVIAGEAQAEDLEAHRDDLKR
jgi:hypothetical protein